MYYATYPDYLPKPLSREGDGGESPVTKIFDYQKFSDEVVQRFAGVFAGEPVPDPNVYIYFCNNPFNELNQATLIYATVVTEKARNDVGIFHPNQVCELQLLMLNALLLHYYDGMSVFIICTILIQLLIQFAPQ